MRQDHVLGMMRVPYVIQAARMLPMNQQVLQMAVIVTRSLGCASSVTRLGEAVVQKVRPNPRMNLLTTNMANVTLSHCSMAPTIMMMLPTVMPHLLPNLSATIGAKGAEHMAPRDRMALIRPSLAPAGFPKKSSQYVTV